MSAGKFDVPNLDDSLTFQSGDLVVDVFRKIDRNELGACFYISDGGKLLGVLTDGDIRRALIKTNSLSLNASDIAEKNFSYAYVDEPVEAWAAKISNEVKILPLVDREHKLVSYYAPKMDRVIPISGLSLSVSDLDNLANAAASGWISSSGYYVQKFEQDFAGFCDVDYSTTTSSGTSALHLALLSLGIGPGDEVIVPNLTFAASINAVLHCGATPVLADVEETSWCICPEEIKRLISNKTKCVMVVHLCGQIADMDAILQITRQAGLYLVEDCAEAHGGRYKGRAVGSIGDVGCFSFFANKIISSGEGGMCTTQSEELFKKMNILKNHGMSPDRKYWHISVGYNYRITNMQAAVGVAQLENIEEHLKTRKQYEDLYKCLIPKLGFDANFQIDLEDRNRVTWLVSAILNSESEKDRLNESLSARNIETRPFFVPLSNMPIYESFSSKPLKRSLEIGARGIFLPTFNDKTNLEFIKYKGSSK